MELFKQAAGIDLLHVPYRGGAAAAAATAAGEVAATMAAPSAAPLVSAGRLRPLARTGERPQEGAAALPLLARQFAEFPVSAWVGLFAPAGTPAAVIDRLRGEVTRSLADPVLQATFARAGGLRPLELEPAEFARLIRSDHKKYGDMIARLGLKLD
jgi:tripartite-type tricarboxylate transporter receptor subunit TctC